MIVPSVVVAAFFAAPFLFLGAAVPVAAVLLAAVPPAPVALLAAISSTAVALPVGPAFPATGSVLFAAIPSAFVVLLAAAPAAAVALSAGLALPAAGFALFAAALSASVALLAIALAAAVFLSADSASLAADSAFFAAAVLSAVAVSVGAFAVAFLDFETGLQVQMLIGCGKLKWTAFELLLGDLLVVIALDLVPVVMQYEAVPIQDASSNDSPLESNTGHLPEAVEFRVCMIVPLIFKNDQYKVILFLKT